MIAYVDSSVWLRVVLGQRNALRDFKRIERAVTSSLTEVECFRTLDRARLRGDMADAPLASARETISALLARAEVLELNAVVLRRAAQPMPTQLGTLDAIHLASALLWHERFDEALTFATHDDALGIAARAHGIPVVGV